jgi:hypothetical protein
MIDHDKRASSASLLYEQLGALLYIASLEPSEELAMIQPPPWLSNGSSSALLDVCFLEQKLTTKLKFMARQQSRGWAKY